MKESRKRLLSLKLKGEPYSFLIDKNTIESVSDTKSLFQIEIFPLLKCNVNCVYCDRGKENSVLKDFRDIAILYNNLRKGTVLNINNFRISGGEPTLYPKINELISFLHKINPYSKVDMITNGIELRRITRGNLKKINLCISIYPYTVKILQKSRYICNLFQAAGYKLKPNITFHEDLSAYGKIKINFPAVEFCLRPVLLGGTKKVYPCCRAHRLEQDYKKKYHFYIDTPGLYAKLRNAIENTDLCSHCPRVYKDTRKVDLQHAKPNPVILKR